MNHQPSSNSIPRRTILRGMCLLPAVVRAASIHLNPASARKLQPAVFSTAAMNDLGGLRPESPVLAKLLQAIRPPVLRLPAGNAMNLWDWNAGAMRTAEQLRRFGADPTTNMSKGPVAGREAFLKKMGGPMTPERWAALARQGGSEPLWGLNVSTMLPEENRAFLLHLKQANLPAHLFELGNELYLSQNWGDQIHAPEDYVSKAKAHAAEVRKVFPNARIAVCVNANDDRTNSPLAKAAPDRFHPAPLNAWNAALQKESFYDAVVIHLYYRPSELRGLNGVTARDFANWANVRCSAFCVDDILDWAERTFPRREIWATEWNLNNKSARGAKTHPFLAQHTILHGLFVANFLLNAASAASRLTIANYWQLNGDPLFGLIGPAPYRQRPQYHVFRMLSPAVHECDRIARLALPDAPKIRGPRQFDVIQAPQLTGFALLRGNEPRYLAFVNFTEERFPVQFTSSAKAAALEFITASQLLPGWNNPNNPSPNDWHPPYELNTRSITPASFTLEPRSFSVIRL